MARQKNKFKYLDKIKPVIRKSRFSQLNMDDVARYMDISKATLYKYFSSKDEIMELFVDHCIDYLKHADVLVLDKDISFVERFQKTYEHALKCVIYVPDILLQDLKEIYPDFYERLTLAEQNRNHNLRQFIESGMEKGVFNQINATLFTIQDEVVLRRIVEPSFSIRYDLTLKKALFDFYILKKHQLIKPELLHTVDDSAMENQISEMMHMISR
jgi:AcrR family transcriptional regulator